VDRARKESKRYGNIGIEEGLERRRRGIGGDKKALIGPKGFGRDKESVKETSRRDGGREN